jgi:hypothetical protein
MRATEFHLGDFFKNKKKIHGRQNAVVYLDMYRVKRKQDSQAAEKGIEQLSKRQEKVGGDIYCR